MTTRERTLAIVLLGLILVAGGGAASYVLVYMPIQQKTAAARKLDTEIEDLDAKLKKAREDSKRLAVTKRRSLPADENNARAEYTGMMHRLLLQAKVPPGFSVVSKPAPVDRTIPQLPGKKPAYAKIITTITFQKVDMWAVQDFLRGYYDLNLLHQITAFSIKRDDDPAAAPGGRARAATDRKDLTVTLVSEALVLDGAEARRTLLPVAHAFGAAGGGAGFTALGLSPEAGRGLTPVQFVPVLSTHNRDYSLVVLNDMFHGPLPKDPFRIPRIADVRVEPGQPIPPVKVPVAGDVTGKVTLSASTDSPLFPTGSVNVDQATHTISFTPAPGETGSAAVTVVAKAATGEETKATFNVAVVGKKGPGEDIAVAIKLIIAGTRSDGTAFATIRDNANRRIYEVEATPRRVKVLKYYYLQSTKKKDIDYDTPDELVIADDWSSTKRQFKIVAVDSDGLVLIDLKPGAAKAPIPGPGRAPIPGRDRMGQGPADPLAGVAGTAATAARPPQPQQPEQTLYRWENGKSLDGLTVVPRDEARKILQRAAETGPVGATAVAAEAPTTGN